LNTKFWSWIAGSSDGTKLVAVETTGASGNVYTSTDSGATWTLQTSAGIHRWSGCCSDSTGTKLFACAYNNNYIYSSNDSGSTWTQLTTAGARQWGAITCSSDGTKLCAAVNGGDIYRSSDSGATWTPTGDSNLNTLSWYYMASSSDGTKLCANVNGGDIYRSSDSGATWTPTGDSNLNTLSWDAIASNSDGSQFISVVYGGDIYISNDSGATWTPTGNSSLNTLGWQAAASDSSGTKLVAGIYGGDIYTGAPPGPVTLTYDGNGSTSGSAPVDPNSPYAYGSSVSVLGNTGSLVKTGYTFSGWNTAADGTGTTYIENDTFTINADTILYAKWNVFICFAENSTILCIVDGKETYVPVQDLRKGTLVKTSTSGVLPVTLIGSSQIYNPANELRYTNRLFRLPKSAYPELTEDLIITGGHSILVPALSEAQKEAELEEHGRLMVTEDKYRLMALHDERAVPHEDAGLFNIWHFSLENEQKGWNYGVYANGGLLVESASEIVMQKRSGMVLLE